MSLVKIYISYYQHCVPFVLYSSSQGLTQNIKLGGAKHITLECKEEGKALQNVDGGASIGL